MTIGRQVAVLLAMTAIGVAAVALRVEQVQHTRRIEALRAQEASLRQRIWEQEMELARLRSPQMIRERAARLGVSVLAANTGDGSSAR